MEVKTIYFDENKEISLTCYIPDISDEMPNMKVKPGILVLPGGAYKFCSDREAEPIALHYVSRGYNAFVLRYSLNEASKFPRPLNEASEALRMIRENAEQWHTDPQKIAVIGFSAGGHLAAALSTMADEKPNASILCYPCILGEISPILANEIESVTDYVTNDTPPAFIVSADDDTCVPIKHSLQYASKLDEYGVSFEMHIYRAGGHGFSLGNDVVMSTKEAQEFSKPTSYWLDRSVEWLHEIFE